jgi:hypothetical protein
MDRAEIQGRAEAEGRAGGEWRPCRSIVVIHGVGDHQEDVTAKELARALGRTMSPDFGRCPPTFVSKRGDVQSQSGAERDTESFTFASYEISVLGMAEGEGTAVYELYWANLTRGVGGLLAELEKTWRFLVGMPRLGYHALVARGREADPPRLLRLARFVYCAGWVLLVFRLVAALALILVMSYAMGGEIRYYRLPSLRYYDVLLVIDVATDAILVAFGAILVGLALADFATFRVAWTAALALAATLILTQAVPTTIAEVTGFDEKANALTPWFQRGENGTPSWLYSFNNLPGFAPYFTYGLITVWVIGVMLVGYGIFTRMVPFQGDGTPRDRQLGDRVAGRMHLVLEATRLIWAVLAIVALFVTPALFLVEFAAVFLVGGRSITYTFEPGASGIGYYFEVFQFSWFFGLSYFFIIVLWGMITWPKLRLEIAPALELACDIGLYFPPIHPLDDSRAIRYLLGGGALSGDFKALAPRLDNRLRALIRHAHDLHGGPVAVVGHSLGSIIALSALRGPTEGGGDPGAEAVLGGVEIDLVTMGSPSPLLTATFPHLLDTAGPGGPRGLMRGVRRWLNIYRSADLVGREIDFGRLFAAVGIPCENKNIANGGHAGYFEDDKVANYLVGWLYKLPAGTDGTRAVETVDDRETGPEKAAPATPVD